VKNLSHRQTERGATIAEFAVVALLFFTIVFGIIEFGRLLYTHNALTDATRKGARYASLHTGASATDQTAVKNYVVYGPNITYDLKGNPNSPPLIAGLTPDMVNVEFDGPDAKTSYGSNLGSATVSIENYQFNLSIPIIGRTLTLPKYTTTTMAESAGEQPADITP